MTTDSEYKYLAIKNWEKYQVIQHGKSAPWCRLYSSLLDDPDFMEWSPTTQLVYLLLLMVRTRVGRNLPNDYPKLIRMMVQSSTNWYPNASRSLSALISSGHLVLTNQQNGYENSGAIPVQRRGEESRVENIHTSTPESDISDDNIPEVQKPQKTTPLKLKIPPPIDELIAYMIEQQFENPASTAQAFLDYYEVRGWRPNGSKSQMKSWKAAVRTWKSRQANGGNGNGHKQTLWQKSAANISEGLRRMRGEVPDDLIPDLQPRSEH